MVYKSSDLVKEGIEIVLLIQLSLYCWDLTVTPLFSFGALLTHSKAYVSVGIRLILLFEDYNFLPNCSLKPPVFFP